MKMQLVAIVALVLVAPVRAQESTRVALVSSAPGAGANSLVDLAQAKLSGQRGLELLERQAVAKVLQEQKLSLSGLVDAGTAVAAGKLLRADVFALVDMDPAGKEALGLVVYDAATGIKLHDAPLPPGTLDGQVEELTAAVKRAAAKRAGGLKGLRTICILSARNADLPRAQDSLGQTIAYLLERRLLAAPKLVLLERKRLDWVTKEKGLAGAAHQDLLASLALVEVEIGRAKNGPGIRAAAYLTDSQGKELGKVEVASAQPQAAEVAAALQQALNKFLQAEPAKDKADPRLESLRFHQEGKRLLTHKEWPAAAQALEAGHALAPADPLIRVALAKALGEGAQSALQTNGKMVVKPKPHLEVPLDKLKPMLQSAVRSLDLRLEAFQQQPHKNFQFMLAHQTAFRDVPMQFFGNTLGLVSNALLDDEAKELRGMFGEQLQRNVRVELEAWAEVARQESSPERPSAAFHYYTMALNNALAPLRAAGLDAKGIDRFLLPMHSQWLEVSQLPGATCTPHSIQQYCQEILTQRDYPKLYEVMAKHPHPIINLYGRLEELRIQAQVGKVAPGQAQIAFQEIQQAAKKAIADHLPDPKHKVQAQDDLRSSLYQFLFSALEKWPYTNQEQRWQDRFGMFDFMLGRNEMVTPLVARAAEHEFQAKDRCYHQRWELIDRALKLADSDQVQLCVSPQVLRFQLENARKRILTERPEFASKVVLAAPPWKEPVQLLRIDQQPGTQHLGAPVIRGDTIFAPGWGQDDGKIRLRLFHISLKDQGAKLLGKVDVKDPPKIKIKAYGFHHIVGCVLGNDQVFVGTLLDGIYAFDVAGGPGRRIGQDLPSQEVESLAFFEGKLYAGLRGGYLVALDPASGQAEILASSRRRERLSPFDDAESFRIPYLVADPQRRRLLFLLYQRPSQLIYYLPQMIASKDTTNGLWEYDLQKKSFQRHLELYFETFLWGSPVRDGRILLAKSGQHQTGAMEYELAKNEGKLLWAVNPIGPYLPKEKAGSREDYFPLRKVQVVRDDWLWSVEPFCRVSLSKRKREFFAPPSKVDSEAHAFPCFCIEPVGTDKLLVGDHVGLWLLQLVGPENAKTEPRP